MQQYFQGARFPLPGNVGYKGEVTYPLPDGVRSSEELINEIVISLPFKKRMMTVQVVARIPITII